MGAWVSQLFALFGVLLWVGIQQLFPRRAGLTRVTVMPVVMTALAVYGVVSAFADTPWALAAWAATALLVGAATLLLAPASTAQISRTTTRRPAASACRAAGCRWR